MGKIEEVAKLFGLKLGEEFHNKYFEYFKLTDNGLQMLLNDELDIWAPRNGRLWELISGEMEVLKGEY